MQTDGFDIQAFTIMAFCRVYGIGRTKAYEEISTGRLRTKKVGRRTLILKSDVEAWVAALPSGARPDVT